MRRVNRIQDLVILHRVYDQGHARAVSAMVLRALVLDQENDALTKPVSYADSVAKKMLPDLIPYRVGSVASYSFEGINGRRPSDDAMDAVLSIFMGRPVTDNANTFDRHPKSFPYVSVIDR